MYFNKHFLYLTNLAKHFRASDVDGLRKGLFELLHYLNGRVLVTQHERLLYYQMWQFNFSDHTQANCLLQHYLC